MDPSAIQAVEDVHLLGDAGRVSELQWFYGELASLDVVDPVDPGDGVAVLCFRSGPIRMFISLEASPRIDPIPERVTIRVRSLESVRLELDERRMAYDVLRGLMWTDRCLSVLDPSGNRVILRQNWMCFGL